MAKIKIFGDSAVITSDLKLETLKQMRRVTPKALVLMKGTGEKAEPAFAITLGSISIFCDKGAQFTGANDEGYAQMTLGIDPAGQTSATKLEFFKENYALPLAKLNQLEDQIAEQAEALADIIDGAMDNISVVE